ncbi:hypothetical protein LINPERPRIM_LOCUS20257 [Linum perenne]
MCMHVRFLVLGSICLIIHCVWLSSNLIDLIIYEHERLYQFA